MYSFFRDKGEYFVQSRPPTNNLEPCAIRSHPLSEKRAVKESLTQLNATPISRSKAGVTILKSNRNSTSGDFMSAYQYI